MQHPAADGSDPNGWPTGTYEIDTQSKALTGLVLVMKMMTYYMFRQTTTN